MIQTISTSPIIDFFLSYPATKHIKGDVILDYNAYSPKIFYIAKGHVRAYQISPSGREKIYVFYQQNDLFPIVWTFNDINKQLSYEAMDSVIAHGVPREAFLDFIKDKPDILFDIIHRIVDRHSFYVDRVDNLCHPNGRKRVIKLLITLAKRFGREEKGSILIQLPLTHTDVASSIAMTRETASRELRALQKKGIICKFNDFILIGSVQELEDELHRKV